MTPGRDEFLPAGDPPAALLLRSTMAASLLTLGSFTYAISCAAFIFTDELAPFLSVGVIALLLCVIVPNFFVAFFGSNRATVCGASAATLPVVATLVAGIAGTLSASGQEAQLLATIVAGIGAGTILTGVVLYALGRFRMGNLIRYVPYPVIGGFFAGIGYLLVVGGIETMAGAPLDYSNPAVLINEKTPVWVLGVVFGLGLVVAQRHSDHWALFPTFLTGTAILIYGFLALQGIGMEEATEMGFFMAVDTEAGLWPPMPVSDLVDINFGAIAKEIGALAVIAMISAISLLVDSSGIEIVTREDIDLDRELKVLGFANVFTGAVGGSVGVHTAGDTVVSLSVGAGNRLTALCYSALTVAAVFLGANIIQYIPVPILGGVVVYAGSLFLFQWLGDEIKKLQRPDYLLVLVVMVAIAVLGVLQGVGVGLMLAILLFAYNYSQVEVVKFTFPGGIMETNVDRPREHVEVLDSEGNRIHAYVLEGYLFFGSSYKLLGMIRARLADTEQVAVGYLLLDFRLVTQIDSSAAFSFNKLKILAEQENFTIVLTQLSEKIEQQLQVIEFFSEDGEATHSFSDISEGGAWCQEQLLAAVGVATSGEKSLDELLQYAIPDRGNRALVGDYFERLDVVAGEQLFLQGDPGDDLYLIGAGSVEVLADVDDGSRKRLRTLTVGSVFGEMALYTQDARSASAVIGETGTLYRLSLKDWQRLSTDSPLEAAGLHVFIVRLLSDRLARTNIRLMRALS